MSCPAITTGGNFLASVLAQVDCQAASLGTSGFAALSDPASGVIAALTALLTLFIALFGLRLMLGRDVDPSDLVSEAIKVGIVLTLALSWPAWRIVGYDVVMKAPQQLAGSMARTSGLAIDGDRFTARLQNADDGMVALIAAGSGRLTGGVAAGTDLGDTSRGVALADQTGLGYGRLAYLIGTIAPLAIVRLGGGILIAIAPLMAGLLLFGGTSGIFFGWLRALGAMVLGNLALILVYGVELAAIEPWIGDVLSRRASNILTPAAPGELLAMTLAFALIAFSVLALILRMTFFGAPAWPRLHLSLPRQVPNLRSEAAPLLATSADGADHAGQISEAVARSVIREARVAQANDSGGGSADQRIAGTAPRADSAHGERQPALGASWRRTRQHGSRSAARRDGRT